MDTMRVIIPPLLALVTVLLVDFSTRRRGLQPPWFQVPVGADPSRAVFSQARRALALALLWLVLWFGVFMPLGSIGLARQLDLSQLSRLDLFLLHFLLLLYLAVWYLCGYVPQSREPSRRANTSWTAQLGLRTDSVLREVGIGLAIGVVAWLAVIGVLLLVGVVIWWLGGEDLLPTEPPELIPWIAALPMGLRGLISLSAGVVEETFFRGLLQPRTGLILSTLLFVIAHASYEQPLMLFGVTMLSLIYGGLVLWRQNIWAAMVAHAFFDAVQLLVVIPAALRVLPGQAEGFVLLRLLCP